MSIMEEIFNGVTVLRIKDADDNFASFKLDEIAGVGTHFQDNNIGIILKSGVIMTFPCKSKESLQHVYRKFEAALKKNDKMVTAYQAREGEAK